MKPILAIALVMVMAGCYTDEEFVSGKTGEGYTSLKYYRDERTGLCFAGYNPRYREGILTNVPCTPAVVALIDKQVEKK